MSEIKHVEGRIIVKVDKEQKNHVTFSDGTVIRLERDYNNLDRSYTQQVFGVVIDAENIPKDALILFHFNALHDTYKVFNHSNLSGEEIASGIEIYSILERDCYLWKMAGEEDWNPCKNYAIAERVFEPYKGILQGIEPTKIKDVLYVKTGELKGKVVKTLKACDAALIFRNEKGVDETIIRFRPFGSKEDQREEEAIAIMNNLTDRLHDGELLVGTSISDAKPLEITAYAD
jgi:hypothetical protein